MSKLARLLTLVNLLSHRSSVSMKTIQQVCGIPERTVYRYLKVVSEANIPVYFDKSENGYRLARSDRGSIKRLYVSDMVLILTGLRRLAEDVNDYYTHAITGLITNLISQQGAKLEDITELQGETFRRNQPAHDLSEGISEALIRLALKENRGVRVYVLIEDSGIEHFEMTKPTLVFKNGWCLLGRGEKEIFALSDIVRVEVI